VIVCDASFVREDNERERSVREGVALVVTLMPGANLKKVREKGARKAACARKKEKGARVLTSEDREQRS
ncbi:hypothetical protein ALC60_02339, partial [Trachymyrmex zeteki]